MKTSRLTGTALDWVVAKCKGNTGSYASFVRYDSGYNPSTDWSQGGSIIEQEKIKLEPVLPKSDGDTWFALIFGGGSSTGPTPLIAAMRCFVISKLGHEIEIPEELK